MNIGFDIDGVISNFVAGFVKVVENDYSLILTEADIYCHDLNLVLGIAKEERNKLIRKTILKGLELNPGAKETLAKLSSEGHRIFILTARSKDLIETTKKWLEEKTISYYQLLHFDEGKKYQTEANLEIIVEDNLEDAISLSQKVKNVLIYDHPWNQTKNVKKIVKRVYDWNDIYKEIRRLVTLPKVPSCELE
jgi:uncharacterized HAD superfamily protein